MPELKQPFPVQVMAGSRLLSGLKNGILSCGKLCFPTQKVTFLITLNNFSENLD